MSSEPPTKSDSAPSNHRSPSKTSTPHSLPLSDCTPTNSASNTSDDRNDSPESPKAGKSSPGCSDTPAKITRNPLLSTGFPVVFCQKCKGSMATTDSICPHSGWIPAGHPASSAIAQSRPLTSLHPEMPATATDSQDSSVYSSDPHAVQATALDTFLRDRHTRKFTSQPCSPAATSNLLLSRKPLLWPGALNAKAAWQQRISSAQAAVTTFHPYQKCGHPSPRTSLPFHPSQKPL